MSLIPQLMSGRKLEHDLKFASDGPMSGLVEGVQIETLGATSTFVLKETTTANEFQLKASILALDPGGAGRIVKLPAAITDGPDLAGRMLRIFNSADESAVGGSGGGSGGELIQLQQSDGTHICTIGKDDYADILFIDQSTPIEIKKLKKHSVELANTDMTALISAPSVILPAISTIAYQIQFVKFVYSGTVMTNGAGNLDVKLGSTIVADPVGTILQSAGTTFHSASDTRQEPTLNQSVTITDDSGAPTGPGDATSKFTVTVFYYEF